MLVIPVRLSCTNTLCVLLQPCVLIRSHKNHKEHEHVQNLVFVVALRQSCCVVHKTVRLPQETDKIVVVERCMAAARLM